MLLYYITDRTQFSGNESDKRRQVLRKIAECTAAGIPYIQLREKDGQLNCRGLEQLERACKRPQMAANAMPVFALGGITLENARRCLDAGAAGIAAIRLFQQNDVEEIIGKLRQSLE